MRITREIFKKNSRHSRIKSVSVDLFSLSTELYNEFERLGFIDRLKDIPQLGSIYVTKALCKSRYDYVILQWWLHKRAHELVNPILEYSYASTVRAIDVDANLNIPAEHKNHTITEYLQVFILAYNVGHFYSTFVSSRAILLKLQNCNQAKIDFVAQFAGDATIQDLCNRIIDENDYYHYHLLNSILALNACNQGLFSVRVARWLIVTYLSGQKSKKMDYMFRVFRSIRNLSLTTFDLQLAIVPFRIYLQKETSLKTFLAEYLAQYNDNTKAQSIVLALSKLLSDTVYNENVSAIREYGRAIKTSRALPDDVGIRYYNDFFCDSTSLLNQPPKTSISIDTQCLKLTFLKTEETIAINLFNKLQHTHHVRSTIYSRHYGDQTIVISTTKHKQADSAVLHKILKLVITSLRSIKGIKESDPRFLLVTKYFLRSVFEDRRFVINATGSTNECLYCVKGRQNRLRVVDEHLKYYNPAPDPTRHEVEYLRNIIASDIKNDTAILIPSSLILYSKSDLESKTELELDGLILYPYRRSGQVVFLESKISRDAGHSNGELRKKLNKLNIAINEPDFHYTNPDSNYVHSI